METNPSAFCNVLEGLGSVPNGYLNLTRYQVFFDTGVAGITHYGLNPKYLILHNILGKPVFWLLPDMTDSDSDGKLFVNFCNLFSP